jgi:hypothetical protein
MRVTVGFNVRVEGCVVDAPAPLSVRHFCRKLPVVVVRTRMYIDGHSYSLFDPLEIHRDMREDPVQARRVMQRNKQILTAHEFCNECRDILASHDRLQADAGSYVTLDDAMVAHAERVAQYVVSRANLARMLDLGPGERIVRMYVTDDPQMLHVVITGEHFAAVVDGAQVPVLKASRTDPAAGGS